MDKPTDDRKSRRSSQGWRERRDWCDVLNAGPWHRFASFDTDQQRGSAPPPVQKPYPEDAPRVDLVAPDALTVGGGALIEAIRGRRSRRSFTPDPLTLEELSFLLWATQGAARTGEGPDDLLWSGVALLRTVPSAGARHPFETTLLVRRVDGVTPGLYRYLPLEHQLLWLASDEEVAPAAAAAWGDRGSLATSAVVFIWTAVPYRTVWRYGPLSAKLIALDAGHVCQNLYLACEAIGCGTCAIGAYDQAAVDKLVGADGEEELTVYLAPVGKV